MKKNNKLKLFFSLFILGIISVGNGQTDTLDRGTVEIKRTYKPEIRKGEKFFSAPLPETATVAPPIINYAQISLPKPANILPALPHLKALSLPPVKIKKLYGNFLKIGFGNYNAPFAEGSLMMLRSKSAAAGLNIHHFSNNGKSDDRKWSENQADAYYALYKNLFTWNSRISFEQDTRRFYAYNNFLYPIGDAQLTKIYNSVFKIATDITSRNDKPNKDSLQYQIRGDFYSLINQYKQQEKQFSFSGMFKGNYKGRGLALNTGMDLMGFEGFYTYNRLFFRAAPAISLRFGSLLTNIGARAVFRYEDNNSVTNQNYFFYPDLQAQYQLKNVPVYINAAITGDMQASTRQHLYRENPFIGSLIYLGNLQSNKINLGVHSNLGAHWKVNLSGSYNYNSTLPVFFYTYRVPYTSDSLSRFSLVYKQINFRVLQLGSSYQDASWTFRSNVSVNHYEFQEDSLGLMRPLAEADFHLEYRLDPKLSFRTDLYLVSKRKVGYADENYKNFRPLTTAKGYADFSFTADYKYNDQTGAFLTFRNIANNRYARWVGYPVNGINFLAGVNLTF